MVPGADVAGRYSVFGPIAAGGSATVHIGRLVAQAGFTRTVAIKRLHPHLATDPEFVARFMDEARLAARVRHANVVPVLDVVAQSSEVLIVMEYVEGAALSSILGAARGAVPAPVALAIACDMLEGLHAAHVAVSETGESLHVVHRDVSPQNVLVGADGVARIVDFGIAKAANRAQTTREGQVKGKLSYMAPEQLRGGAIDRRVDVYAASVVLWEMLAGRRLFDGELGAVYGRVLEERVLPPSAHAPGLDPALDRVVLTGLSRARELRYATAREMLDALRGVARAALASDVAEWLEANAAEVIDAGRARVRDVESGAVSPREAPEDSAIASALNTWTTRRDPVAAVDARRGAPAARARGAPVGRWATLAGAALVVLAGGAAFARARRAPPEVSAAPRGAAASGAIAPEPAAPAAPPAPSEPAEIPERAARVEPPAPTAKARAAPPAKKLTAPTASAHPALPANCHVLDASGVWHIRPECMPR